jgi:hypothetical protein
MPRNHYPIGLCHGGTPLYAAQLVLAWLTRDPDLQKRRMRSKTEMSFM